MGGGACSFSSPENHQMAKARPTSTPKRKSPRTPTLASLRRSIDRIDGQLIKLINERAKLALKAGRLKESDDRPIYAPAREEDVLGRVVAKNTGPLDDRCVRAVFRELISGSRSLEAHLKVAYLGPAFSYSHLAAIHRFGHSVELIPVANIATVFEEVNREHADFGLVPLENSTDGRVADTLDMFTRLPLRICGEVQMRIHHTLLACCPRSEVMEVYSKPQALSQCRNWLSKHLPSARTIEVTSTSTAAKLAKDKPGAAAIASLQAGIEYGLTPLAENIEDNAANLTRFAVIGDQGAERTGQDKSAIMFEIEHRPGALAEAMSVFKRNKVNMSWIESFPIPSQPNGAYMFFIEFDGHCEDAKIRRTINAVEKSSLRFEFLGSYPDSEPVG